MDRMKIVPFYLVCIAFFLSACAPTQLSLVIDSKVESNDVITLNGRSAAVVSITRPDDRDSALVVEMGLGVAEGVEKELGLESGTIKVFSYPSSNIDRNKVGSLDLLALQHELDLLIVVDSLIFGHYSIPLKTTAYIDDSFKHFSEVTLPYSLTLSIYDRSQLGVKFKKWVNDTLSWSIVHDEEVANSVAINRVNGALKQWVRAEGESVAKVFLPKWNTQERTIISFSGLKWQNGYYLAYDFKWEEAIDVWLSLVKSSNPKKSGAAAYNIAVACEILGEYQLARKWLDYANGKCYFSPMTTLSHILKSEGY